MIYGELLLNKMIFVRTLRWTTVSGPRRFAPAVLNRAGEDPLPPLTWEGPLRA